MTVPRIGFGFDVHRFAPGRALWIGGVRIPHELGLAGHSDADVLLHAVCDALLGAMAMGDIGTHFPDTDPQWKDADSKLLLEAVVKLIHAAGWQVGNVDCTLVMEHPKVMPHAPAMRAVMAALLQVPADAVSIKATTNEAMGYVGRGEGVCAHAVVLVHRAGSR